MRKSIAVLLVTVCAVTGGRAFAADRAGIALEWGFGPDLVLGGGFSMLMDEQSSLNWDVSNDFAVSVFAGNGIWRGSKEYTNSATPAIKHKLTVEGSKDLMGIAVVHSFPGMSFLKLGIELGMINLDTTNQLYSNSDGTVPAGTEFGTLDTLNQTASLEGLMAKLTLLKGESKGTYADVSVLASLRFVQLPTTYIYGTQEADSTLSPRKGIDPIASYNNLAIKLVASLGF